MSSLLKCLTQYLDTRVATLRTTGTPAQINLFAGIRTHTAPDMCVLLQESVGTPEDPMQPNEQQRRIQILTRAKTYFVCEALARECFDALCTTASFELPLQDESDPSIDAWTVHSITGVAPAYVGEDDRSRIEFSCNLTVRVRKET